MLKQCYDIKYNAVRQKRYVKLNNVEIKALLDKQFNEQNSKIQC